MASLKWFVGLLLLVPSGTLLAEEVVLSVNIKKPLATTSEKFLSITLDSTAVLTGNLITNNGEKSVNMAKALSPGYVRIAGPRSNSYSFVRGQTSPEQDIAFIFTEANWNSLNGWARSAGLDVVMAIAPQQHSEAGGTAARDSAVWDSRNILDLISFTDHMEYNVSWQLGYECQTRCDINGGDLGRDVMRLRNMLEAFPRYARSIIVGPDVVTFKTKLQQIYLQDYLNAGISGLSAITWHPEFASIAVDSVGVSMHHDNLAADRDVLYRIIGRHMAKKALWLAESRSEECKKQFLGALVWTRRLGNSAKVGAQVLMRQPQDSNLEPTPDYWVSVLHKTLVGREVLDTKIAMGNRTHIHFYCQCTKPSSKYEKGSLTVFGINLTPAKLVVSLKGLKIKTLHKYILLPGFDAENRMFSETVLLNNELLKLQNDTDIPEINPIIATNGKGLTMKLPSGGIGFWVIPDLKVKSCEGQENDNVDKMLLKKLSKRLEEIDSEEENDNDEMGEEEIEDNSEDRRLPIKTSSNKKRRSRKNQRYSNEEDEVIRYKKLDARRDLERLEKLLKWRGNLEEKRLLTLRGKAAQIGYEDKSYESQSNGNGSEEEIRAKLQLYKRRLDEYGTRKKNLARSRDNKQYQQPQLLPSTESDTLDNENIEEAMRLITKVENSIKSLEQQNDSLLENQFSNKTTDPEEHFLDELLKTRKIKRASVPEKIEQQLRAIYEMLAEEKKRRQKLHNDTKDGSLIRAKRDTDRKFGDDPLGLRKDSFFTRRRNRNDEIKERRFGKSRKKDDNNGPVTFDQIRNSRTDSNENNFYGFGRREPIEGFPEGDVYVMTGVSSEEKTTNNDYDYIGDDEDMQPDKERKKKSKNAEPLTNSNADIEEPWIEDSNAEIGHIPKEFLENIHFNTPKIDKHLANYGELWEAESLADAHAQDRDFNGEGDQIIQEKPLDAHLDKQAKETAVKQLIGYYETSISQQSEEDDTVFRQPKKERKESTILQNQRKLSEPMTGKQIKDIGQSTEIGATNFRKYTVASSSMELDRMPKFPQEIQSKIQSRPRRNLQDLDSILNKEMIFQDENNLKDCNCRVIRGDGLQRHGHNCNLSRKISKRKEHTEAKKIARRDKNGRGIVLRNRRDAQSEQEYDDYDDIESEYTDQQFNNLQTTEQQQIQITSEPTIFTSPLTTTATTTTTTTQLPLVTINIDKTQQQLPAKYNTKSSHHVKRFNQNIESQENQTESTTTIANISNVNIASNTSTMTSESIAEIESTTHSSNGNEGANKSTDNLSLQEQTTIESIGKPKAVVSKNNNSNMKNIPNAGSLKGIREPRLITKSESSLAVKAENNNKKVRKTQADTSLKSLVGGETAKLEQLHKKRQEHLDKLRGRLKTRRSKFQESISLDDLTKLNDGRKNKTLQRRETMGLSREGHDDNKQLQDIVDEGKWDYVMLHKPNNRDVPFKRRNNENINDRPITEKSNYARKSTISMSTYTDGEFEQSTNDLVIVNSGINEANSHDAIVVDDSTKSEEIYQYPSTEFNTEDERISNGEPEESSPCEINDKQKKSQFICLREDSSEISQENPETFVKIVKKDGHYVAIPLNERNKEDKKSHADGKLKYKSPKYVRLAAGKETLPSEEETEYHQQYVKPNSFNLDDVLNSNKFELMMLIPLNNQRQTRQKREISNEIKRTESENDVWANVIHMKRNDKKEIDDMTRSRQDPLSSLVEETIPKIEDVVTDGLGKAQNVTGSIEKLIDKIEENINEADNIDEKTQFQMEMKNNPDGLMTHDFFYNTIEYVKTFFDFLTGITHVFFNNTAT